MNEIRDAYRLLGIPEGASEDLLTKTYLKRHADYQADPGSDPWEFQQVQQAYELLRDRQRGEPIHATHEEDDDFPTLRASSVQLGHRVPPSPTARSSTDESAVSAQPSDVPKHLLWQAFFRRLPLQNETSVFIAINVMDIFMTYLLLSTGGIETNPIANYFQQRWGFDGMILLKMLSVAFVSVLAQVIAVKDIAAAKRLLIIGSLIVFGVVVYSAMLLMRTLR